MGACSCHRAARVCFPDTDRADGATEIGGSSERQDRAGELPGTATATTTTTAAAAGTAEAAAAEDRAAGYPAADSAAASSAAGSGRAIDQCRGIATACATGTAGTAG